MLFSCSHPNSHQKLFNLQKLTHEIAERFVALLNYAYELNEINELSLTFYKSYELRYDQTRIGIYIEENYYIR